MSTERAERDSATPTTTAERAAPATAPPPRLGGPLLELQRRAGNRAVQARLEVGRVDDPAEREADAMAASVIARLAAGAAPGAAVDDETSVDATPVARLVHRRDGGDGPVGAEGGPVDDDTGRAIDGARGRGSALPAALGAAIGSAMGADFSGVSVHTDTRADQLSRSLGATAFTTGTDVFFRKGAYDPGSSSGRELLSHELAHVVQQTPGVRRRVIRRDKTENKARGVAGLYGEVDNSSDTFDGTTQTTTSHQAFGLAGAEAIAKRLGESTDTEIKETVEAMARAGLFGESAREATVERGGVKGTAKGKAAGSIGADANAKASTTIKHTGLYPTLVALAEVGAKVGAAGDLEGELIAAFGPVGVGIAAKLKVFVGALGRVKGRLDIGLLHLHIEGEARVMAGAEVEGEAVAKITLSNTEASLALEGKAFAGAAAEAKGSFRIDLTGVELAVKVEAFAGVRAEASAKGKIEHKGRTVISAKGTIEVQAGIGGKAKAKFGFNRGKLSIEGDLGACWGIGTGVAGELEIDFYALAMMIEDEVVTAFFTKKEEINRNSPAVERVPLASSADQVKYRKLGYETVLTDFMAYGAKKAKQGNSGIKREQVQAIIDKRYAKLKDAYAFLETDLGIAMAAKDAFGSQLVHIDVQSGQIRAFSAAKKAGQAERELASLGPKKK